MMSYLFFGALLIVVIQSQDIPECDEECVDPTPICDYFAGAFSNDTAGECVAACTSDYDCSLANGRLSGFFTPYCDEESGACVMCTQDSQCVNNTMFGNDTIYCIDGAPIFPFSVCSSEPSRVCSDTAECKTNWGEDYVCVEYTSDTAEDFGACAPKSETGFCDPTEDDPCADSPFTQEEFFATLDISCTEVTGIPAGDLGELGDYVANGYVCIPESQCSPDDYEDDCLPGSICREFDFDGVFGFDICFISNGTDCETAADCNEGGADEPLDCYAKDGVCYLPCSSNEECITDTVTNWACGSPPNNTENILGCIPLGLENATYLTNSPTVSPVGGPGDGGSAVPLQIFGAFIIMVINFIFN